MANYNRIIMIGNLTRDPDYKQLSSGQAVCRLGIASNRQFKNRQTDTMVQEVCYVDIDVWGAQAESCRQYLQKGRAILVEGRLKLDTWEDQNGQNRSKHSIVAERVVFLSQQSAGQSDSTGSYQDKKMEKDLMNQIKSVKNRSEIKAANKVKESSEKQNSAVFKDEPPFQDDLPF